MEIKTFKYKNREEEAYKVLKHRIEQYFKERNITRHADAGVIIKSILNVLITICSYGLIMTDYFSPFVMLLLAIVFGISSIMLVFNIGHDAAHNAFSTNPKINKFLTNTLYLTGSSAYLWDIKHNLNHHSTNNVPEYDWTVNIHWKILSVDPNKKVSKLLRYQHIYSPPLYCMYSIFLIFYKEFEMFYWRKIGNILDLKPSVKDQIIFFLSKVIYFTMTIALPILFLSVAWWQVLIGFLIMQMAAGFIGALVAIPPHLGEETVFPTVDEEGYLHHSRLTHHLDTTTDFARKSVFANWIFGGLNTHVIHHLFPNICHAHYIPLTQILKDTMDEYGFKYKETTTYGAIRSHYNLLKKLGRSHMKQI